MTGSFRMSGHPYGNTRLCRITPYSMPKSVQPKENAVPIRDRNSVPWCRPVPGVCLLFFLFND